MAEGTRLDCHPERQRAAATPPTCAQAGGGRAHIWEGSARAGRRPSTTRVGNPRGIKENVMGRLIPAGTGLPAYKKLNVVIDEKSPTFAPPTFTRVQPADLVAVGDD